MSAPNQVGGEITTWPGNGTMPASEPAPERPPRGRSGGGSSRLPKPPQGHGPIKVGVEPKRKRAARPTPPSYTNRSVKPQLLGQAEKIASKRGYESLRIGEITEPVGVTRQAFYAHFRDKRHCLAEVISDKLSAIERIASSADPDDAEWARLVIDAVDEALRERFGSPDGTRARILAAIGELLCEGKTLHEITIGQIVKAAHIPQGDFYRQFSTKRECFCVYYELLVGELVAELQGAEEEGGANSSSPGECPAEHNRQDLPECSAEHSAGDLPALLRMLGEALASEPQRLRVLIVESAHLPEAEDPAKAGAWRGTLTDAIAELISASRGVDPADPKIRWLAASALELIRSAALSSQADDLAERLSGFGADYAASLLAAPGRTLAA